MKIHEYQAKEIFSKFGIPVPKGRIVASPEEARQVAAEAGKAVALKAQVLVGGRGKAGGIKVAKTADEAEKIAGQILGMSIKGEIVRKLLVEEAADIESEAYIGIIIDRLSKKPVIMVSRAGGIDIEEVARETPEKIHKFYVEPLTGLLTHQARDLALKLADKPGTQAGYIEIIAKLYRTFVNCDASLAEINPCITTKSGEVIALDAKINIDDNALFRQKEIESMAEFSSEEVLENEAKSKGLSYIKLSGNIGCVVNGAGLAMATMDLIKSYGGDPANFLDIGGSSSPEKVTNAIDILLRDKNVKSLFFNIFGGITRCDDVAKGIISATAKMKINMPIVIRLTGTNEDIAREILKSTDLIPVKTMAEGARKAIELAGAFSRS